MTLGYEINPLIKDKLKEIDDPEQEKFLEKILLQEEENLNSGNLRYSDDYTKILAEFVRMDE